MRKIRRKSSWRKGWVDEKEQKDGKGEMVIDEEEKNMKETKVKKFEQMKEKKLYRKRQETKSNYCLCSEISLHENRIFKGLPNSECSVACRLL
jgi:hypothetical protein